MGTQARPERIFLPQAGLMETQARQERIFLPQASLMGTQARQLYKHTRTQACINDVKPQEIRTVTT